MLHPLILTVNEFHEPFRYIRRLIKYCFNAVQYNINNSIGIRVSWTTTFCLNTFSCGRTFALAAEAALYMLLHIALHALLHRAARPAAPCCMPCRMPCCAVLHALLHCAARPAAHCCMEIYTILYAVLHAVLHAMLQSVLLVVLHVVFQTVHVSIQAC